MIVASARIFLRIEGAQSLKDKRQVIRSLIDRTRRRFGVSVAEVEDHDLWNVATVGLACVSNQAEHARSIVQQAVNHFEDATEAVVEGVEIEVNRFGSE